MIKDILRLKYSAALSHEAIARSLGISKGVVAEYLGLAGAAGLVGAGAKLPQNSRSETADGFRAGAH